jgi:DNA helicase-4
VESAEQVRSVAETATFLLVRIFGTWLDVDRVVVAERDGVCKKAEVLAAEKTAHHMEESLHRELAALLSEEAWCALEAELRRRRPKAATPPGQVLRLLRDHQKQVDYAKALYAALPSLIEQAAERKRHAAAQEARRVALEDECRQLLRTAWLTADPWYEALPAGDRLLLTEQSYRDMRAGFVVDWARAELGETLDAQQAAAVATTAGALRVVARAGAGKTRTLVTRALFLQLHAAVPPSRLLLVAFNRKAVAEIRERIGKHVTADQMPHVLTFHALAHALTEPTERLLYDDPDREAKDHSAAVQDIIDAYLKQPGRYQAIRDAMTGYFRADWERILEQGLTLTPAEAVALRRSLTSQVLAGHSVRSGGEKLIANTLFSHDVYYRYEEARRVAGKTLRPDFTVYRDGKPAAVIEYFGLTGDREYDRNATQKRDLFAKHLRLPFLEYRPEHIAAGEAALSARIVSDLTRCGIPLRRLGDHEIWERIRHRAVDLFSETVTNFVGRARHHNYSPEELRQLITAHDAAEPERDFLELAAAINHDYLSNVAEGKYEDFSGLIWRAVAALEQGRTTFAGTTHRPGGDLAGIQHVLIDEYQDFSPLFYAITRAILHVGLSPSLFAVGDNWQAINEFAGSKLTYFTDFGAYFPGGTTLTLLTNYRSPQKIVELGNQIMSGQGSPARANPADTQPATVSLADPDAIESTRAEERLWGHDRRTQAVVRIVHHALQNTTGKVAVLYRRNTIPWGAKRGTFVRSDVYAQRLRNLFPEAEHQRIEVTTAHKYKGREAETVVLADAEDTSYPLVHPLSVLFRIFGDTPLTLEAAERRLFYVAATRATQDIYLVAPASKLTPFVPRLALATLHWNDYPSPTCGDPNVVEIWVEDALSIHKMLKRLEFNYQPETRRWWIERPREGTDVDQLRHTLGFTKGRRVEVRDTDGHLLHELWAPNHRARDIPGPRT